MSNLLYLKVETSNLKLLLIGMISLFCVSVCHFLISFFVSHNSQTNDYCAVPQELKEQLNERYPGARKAVLKTGGDFPFLSRPDEVNLYLQVLKYFYM